MAVRARAYNDDSLDDYGITWMDYPDEDGVHEKLLKNVRFRRATEDEVSFRLYTR